MNYSNLSKELQTMFVFVLGLFTLSCQPNAQQVELKNLETAPEVIELISNGDIQIVDVRTPAEYNSGHMAGALLINVQDSQFMTKMDGLDKDKPILIYCAVGGRSTVAANRVADLGFNQIYNYKGGMHDWMNRGMEIVK